MAQDAARTPDAAELENAMRAAPLRVTGTSFALGAAALVVFVATSAAALPVVNATDWTLSAVFFGMILVARLYPVRLAPRVHIMVSTAPLFAAALLLPAALAMLIAGLAAGAAYVWRRRSAVEAVFNVAEIVLRVAAGAVIFEAFADRGNLASANPGDWALGVPFAIAAMFMVNFLAVHLMISIQTRRFSAHEMIGRLRDFLLSEGSLYLLGLLVAALGARNPWAAALLAAPSFVVYRALRDGVALKVQTREALWQIADVVDLRDHYTFEHSRRVAVLSRATAEMMGLRADDVDVIDMAARLHDVGKIGIKSSVLMKPDRLSDFEWREMRSHAEIGATLIAKFPEFSRGRELVHAHHERFDGSGYPRRLAGESIPLGARIIAVADAWDAMTSNRAYRSALDLERVYAEIERGRGSQWDPVVVDAFLTMLKRHPRLATPNTRERQDSDPPQLEPALA